MPIGPLLLVERPLGRVVVLLLHEQRDAAYAVELLEVARLPGGEERDHGQPAEDEECVEHPVRHHPARLLGLGLVVCERGQGPRQGEHRGDEQREREPSHCCPGTVGGTALWATSGGFSSKEAFFSSSCRLLTQARSSLDGCHTM